MKSLNSAVLVLMGIATLTACGGGSGGNSNGAQTPNPNVAGAAGLEAIQTSTVQLYNTERGFGCAGVVISEDVILTSGRCVSGSRRATTIYFQDTQSSVRGSDEVLRPFGRNRRPYAGPGYLPGQPVSNADFGLIHFTGGLPVGVVPARLLRDASILQRGGNCYMGDSRQMNPRGRGPGSLPGSGRRYERPLSDMNFSQDQVILRGSQTGDCLVQVGAPTFVMDQMGPLVLGISRSGSATNNCAAEVVYTRVDTYADWISRTAAEFRNRRR